MKTLIAMTTLGLMLSTNYAMAGSLMPYLGPSCNLNILTPDSSEGFFLNKECDTALMLLPSESPIEVGSIEPSMFLARCASVKSIQDTSNDLQTQLNALYENASKEADPLKRAAILKQITDTQAMLDQHSNLYDLVGAIMQVVFNPHLSSDDTMAYVKDNFGLIKQVSFAPAPITKGMLTFAKASPLLGDPVLDIQIPGAQKQDDQFTILGMGAKAGAITFSLGGACPILGYPTPKTDLRTVKVDPANVVIAANYTYSVPVTVSKGYTAKLEMNSFLQSLITESKTKSQFSLRDVYSGNVQALGSTGYTFESHDTTANQQDADYFEKVREAAFLRLAAAQLEQLERVGVLTHPANPEAPNAPNGGYVSHQIGTIHNCSSSSVFGITYSSSCWDEPWIVSTWVDGLSSVTSRNIIDLNFTETETAEDNSVQQQAYTSAMVMKPAAAQSQEE